MTLQTTRPPTMAEAEAVLALMIRNDIAEYGSADSDLEDLTYDWGEIDLDRDAWLLFDGGGGLAGYAAVLPWGEDLRLEFYGDPDEPDAALRADLLALCLARGREMAAGRQQELVARTFVAHSNQADLAVVEQAGFRPGRYFFQMGIDLDRRPPAPQWPPGIASRTVIPGQDDRQLHQLIQDAFYQPGRTPQAFDSWREFMMRPDLFDPELWFLALEGETIIGACLAFDYPTGGWVRQLGVAQSWRGRGVGKALLQTAFGAFYARQVFDVGLTVESERPDAHTFYQTVGMRQVRQYDEFTLTLSPG
jgi:GNAT superfamily N-acetyltransferase